MVVALLERDVDVRPRLADPVAQRDTALYVLTTTNADDDHDEADREQGGAGRGVHDDAIIRERGAVVAGSLRRQHDRAGDRRPDREHRAEQPDEEPALLARDDLPRCARRDEQRRVRARGERRAGPARGPTSARSRRPRPPSRGPGAVDALVELGRADRPCRCRTPGSRRSPTPPRAS